MGFESDSSKLYKNERVNVQIAQWHKWICLKKKSDGLNFDVDINQVKEGQPNSI